MHDFLSSVEVEHKIYIYILSVFVHAIVSGKQNCLVTNIILPKYLLLCSADEKKSYRFGTA